MSEYFTKIDYLIFHLNSHEICIDGEFQNFNHTAPRVSRNKNNNTDLMYELFLSEPKRITGSWLMLRRLYFELWNYYCRVCEHGCASLVQTQKLFLYTSVCVRECCSLILRKRQHPIHQIIQLLLGQCLCLRYLYISASGFDIGILWDNKMRFTFVCTPYEMWQVEHNRLAK